MMRGLRWLNFIRRNEKLRREQHERDAHLRRRLAVKQFCALERLGSRALIPGDGSPSSFDYYR